MKAETRESKLHVLGIESSCDDTGVAIVRQDGRILSNCIHSQLKQHLDHGGIIPTVAKEYHLNNIDNVARRAFDESGLGSVRTDIDAIAVTTRPGLHHSIQVGLKYAKKLAKKYSKPLIPIHHMQAHSLMPLLRNKSIKFPFITLLISGGHCLLAIVKRYNKFDILGSTRDEAPGDLLDKFARRFKLKNLGPPYDSISGGAAIEMLAQRDGADRFRYFNIESAIPMLQINNCDFSFAGYRGSLETVAPLLDDLWFSGDRDRLMSELSHVCASLQRVMLIQMVKKLQRAYLFYRMHWRYSNEDAFYNQNENKHLFYNLLKIDDESLDVVVSGGVAANGYFIDGLKLACKECIDTNINLHAPDKSLCSDNGLMVAWNGLLRYYDYTSNRNNFSERSIQDSVINDTNLMEKIQAEPVSALGSDITAQIRNADFKLLKMTHPEFKVGKRTL